MGSSEVRGWRGGLGGRGHHHPVKPGAAGRCRATALRGKGVGYPECGGLTPPWRAGLDPWGGEESGLVGGWGLLGCGGLEGEGGGSEGWVDGDTTAPSSRVPPGGVEPPHSGGRVRGAGRCRGALGAAYWFRAGTTSASRLASRSSRRRLLPRLLLQISTMGEATKIEE